MRLWVEFPQKLLKLKNYNMKIGILSKNYAAKRLFLNKISSATYKEIRFYNYFLWKNAHLWFLRTIGKLKMSPEEQASKLFYDYKALFPTQCDLFHFFNTVNYSTKTPWVISVESGVPWPLEVIRCVESKDADMSSLQSNQYIKKALYYLSQPNCMGLLTLSKCSENIQLAILEQFPQYKDKIKKKLITLYPPQELLIQSVNEKYRYLAPQEPITFIFVGRDYFRKGGRESVQILSQLKSQYNIRLILISDLRVDEKKYLRTDNDIEEAKELINKNREWIEYYDFLPNEKVIEKIKSAHIALLPTWMDTFGYSILECQACGTPVISTSLRALTEINSNSFGWLIDVPVNKLNNPIHNTSEEQTFFQKVLLQGLKFKIEYILCHQDEIKIKSENCLSRIRQYHDPEKYKEKLTLIYNNNIKDLF